MLHAGVRPCVALVASLSLLSASPVLAADLFSIQARTSQQSGQASYDSFSQLFEGLSDFGLSTILPSYTGAQVVLMTIDFRGLSMESAYTDAGGPRLHLRIARLGVDQYFVGATREQSRTLLREYFKNGDLLGRIMRALAEVSPADPIAGNPASLQARMVSGDFERRFGQLVTGLMQSSQAWAAPARAARPVRLAALGNETPGLVNGAVASGPPWRVGAELSRYSRAGLTSVVATLPFSLALGRSSDAPLMIDGELHYTDTESAASLGGHAGLSYRLKMNDDWYLMPAASAGISGSRALGTVGSLVSASLISALRLQRSADHTLWLGNALHNVRTVNLAVRGYHYDAQLQNTALTTGLTLTLNPRAFTQGGWLEFSLADTRYAGSALYDRRYDELGLSMVRRSVIGGVPVTLRGGLRHLSTTHTRGWGAHLQASF